MRRIRNPRYAPEFLERKLSPSDVMPTSLAPAYFALGNQDINLDPTLNEETLNNVDVMSDSGPSSPYPTDPTPADPGTPDDGNGDPPTDPLPVPMPGPVVPAAY
jgi:hypothetical protein